MPYERHDQCVECPAPRPSACATVTGAVTDDERCRLTANLHDAVQQIATCPASTLAQPANATGLVINVAACRRVLMRRARVLSGRHGARLVRRIVATFGHLRHPSRLTRYHSLSLCTATSSMAPLYHQRQPSTSAGMSLS